MFYADIAKHIYHVIIFYKPKNRPIVNKTK